MDGTRTRDPPDMSGYSNQLNYHTIGWCQGLVTNYITQTIQSFAQIDTANVNYKTVTLIQTKHKFFLRAKVGCFAEQCMTAKMGCLQKIILIDDVLWDAFLVEGQKRDKT